MKEIFDKDKQKWPIKLWLDDIEDGAMKQAINLSNLPYVYSHVAIMPDAHQGYGMPIGGVIATDNVVVPNAVGKDIGCGMCAVKTVLNVEQLNTDIIKKIMGKIREEVPIGFNHHKIAQDKTLMPFKFNEEYFPISNREYESSLYQLGTLGGGNHFIEIQKDSDNSVWIMIHSGSRNIGLKVADHYNDIALNTSEERYHKISKEWELAYLPCDSREGELYLQEMRYCVDFALANRKLMICRISNIIADEMGINRELFWDNPIINIAHNYATLEHHFYRDVMVHRKGATLATIDTIGIIPGSQGSKSYIVKGKGNPDSFNSCSHGAGRRLGRGRARRELNLEEQIKKLNDQGIIHSVRNVNDLEEAPDAYKDIGTVMKNQDDLVEILVELSPLAVIKSDDSRKRK